MASFFWSSYAAAFVKIPQGLWQLQTLKILCWPQIWSTSRVVMFCPWDIFRLSPDITTTFIRPTHQNILGETIFFQSSPSCQLPEFFFFWVYHQDVVSGPYAKFGVHKLRTNGSEVISKNISWNLALQRWIRWMDLKFDTWIFIYWTALCHCVKFHQNPPRGSVGCQSFPFHEI